MQKSKLRTLQEIFKRPAYLAIAGMVSFLMFTLALWLRNLSLLKEIIVSSAFSFSGKILFIVNFFGSIATAVTPFSAFLVILISILFGINASLLIYYIKQAKKLPRKEGIGTAGAFVSGILGIGCASCGSFLLGAILASFGASGLIMSLPLRGGELTILSIALLLLSIFLIAKSIQLTNNKSCSI